MREPQPKTIYLKDYTPPPYRVDEVDLDVDIRDDNALVRARLAVRRNAGSSPLILDGEELQLVSVSLDGHPARHEATPERLTIYDVPERFTLETVSRIVPQKNTKLEGLYATKTGFVTQCEAEGFRRITWYIDRPDVMARYTTTIHANRKRYPVLLSNGNLAASGEEPGGRHWARFQDPYPKPSYLFAMVAADLEQLADRIVTRSGKTKDLYVYVERGKLDQAAWAMECLKRAIRWDETRFGLELDLDQYRIVAVGDFNSGAMENKGLNIFNTKYVLARADTATDTDYLNIDRVVAHEYCHNWTGNRVTCRDWFQLSLKEGLTVFRDQLFSADQGSAAVCRIANVRTLRAIQFPEDAGPLAHPVQPQSYLRIDNFYTATVYNKGAEVIRMMHTLLGAEGFRRGMDVYIRKNDNHAATIEDFVAAMEQGNGVDLSDLRRWYHQAGTPEITIEDRYDPAARQYELTVSQKVPATPGQPEKQPMPVPLAMGLLGPNGDEMPTRVDGE